MKQYILFFSLLLSTFSAFAQWELNIPLYHAQPLSDFKTVGYGNGFGGGFSLISNSFTGRYNPFKVQLGLEFDFFRAKHNSVELELSDPQNGTGRYRLINRHNGISFFSRFSQEVSPKFRFFQDVIIGNRNFKTTSKLKVLYDLTNDYDDVIETAEKESSFRYGAALGFRYNITRVVGFNARIVYNGGGAVDFVDLASLNKAADNSVSYGLKSSAKSPMLFYGIGFNISFAKSDKPSRPNPNYTPRPRQPNPSPQSRTETLEEENRRLRAAENRRLEEENRRLRAKNKKIRERSRKPTVKRKEGGN